MVLYRVEGLRDAGCGGIKPMATSGSLFRCSLGKQVVPGAKVRDELVHGLDDMENVLMWEDHSLVALDAIKARLSARTNSVPAASVDSPVPPFGYAAIRLRSLSVAHNSARYIAR